MLLEKICFSCFFSSVFFHSAFSLVKVALEVVFTLDTFPASNQVAPQSLPAQAHALLLTPSLPITLCAKKKIRKAMEEAAKMRSLQLTGGA